jgi:penicillin G amidase
LSGLEGIAGSNCWVISGKHTKSGKSILAGDPHLKNGIPAMWHMQTMKSKIDGKPIKLMGASLPGLPFILMGRSEHLQYGVTASHSDVSDLYREKLNENETQYLVDGVWRDLEIIKYEI